MTRHMDWMTLTDAQLWEYVLTHPIAGGRQDDPPPPPDPGPDETPPAPAPAAIGLIDGKPQERWDQVYGERTRYKHELEQYGVFGRPDEIKAKLDKLTAYDQAIEQARARGNSTAEEQEEVEKVRKQFLKIFPEMREVMDSRGKLNGVDELRQQYEELALDRASTRFTKVLDARKLDVKYQDSLEDLTMSQMSEAERKSLLKGDYSVLEEVLDRLDQGFLSKFAVTGSAPPAPPKRIGPGGSPPAGTPNKPKTFKEAHSAAFESLQAKLAAQGD